MKLIIEARLESDGIEGYCQLSKKSSILLPTDLERSDGRVLSARHLLPM